MATLAVFTRMLAPADYGLYALGLTSAAIASSLLFQWLTVAMARFYPVFLDRPGVLFAASLRGFSIASLVAFAAAMVALFIGRGLGISVPFLLCVLFATIVSGIYGLFLQVANSQGNPLRYASLGWIKGGITLAAGALFIFLGMSHVGALLGFIAGTLLAMLVVNPLRGIRPTASRESRDLSPKLFSYGKPLILTVLGMIAVDFADRLLIAWQLGTAPVGRYAAAYDLTSQTIGTVTNVLFLAGFPPLANAFEQLGEDTARDHMRSLGRSLIVVGLPVAVGFMAVSADINHVVLGESFRGDTTRIMWIMALATWLSGFRSFYLDAVFLLHKVTGYAATVALTMMAVNIGLNLVFLRIYGILGAACATLAAFAVGATLSFFLGRRMMRLHALRGDFLKTAAAAGFMAAIVLSLPGSHGVPLLIAKIGLGAISYVFAAWLLNIAGIRSWISTRLLPSR
jgi:O-antigen/teichoic acid export membrane protein